MQEKFGLSREDASNSVSFMDSIKGQYYLDSVYRQRRRNHKSPSAFSLCHGEQVSRKNITAAGMRRSERRDGIQQKGNESAYKRSRRAYKGIQGFKRRLDVKILVTNDDGIDALGIRIIAGWAQKLGEVTVSAPKYQQSGKSHSIEINEPFEVIKCEFMPGIPAYRIDSTPADCVRYAMKDSDGYDLVISGINNGYNIRARRYSIREPPRARLRLLFTG